MSCRPAFLVGAANQVFQGFKHHRCLKWFLKLAIRAHLVRLVLIHPFERGGSEQDPYMRVLWLFLDKAAKVVARDLWQKCIDDDDIGIDILEPDDRRLSIGYRHHFEAFFTKDSLAHPLGVGTVVG